MKIKFGSKTNVVFSACHDGHSQFRRGGSSDCSEEAAVTPASDREPGSHPPHS